MNNPNIKKDFFLLGDLINLTNEEPIEVIPGYILKKPNEEQLDRIHNLLLPYDGWNIYQSTMTKVVNENDTRTSFAPLENKKDWKYIIIEHNQNGYIDPIIHQKIKWAFKLMNFNILLQTVSRYNNSSPSILVKSLEFSNYLSYDFDMTPTIVINFFKELSNNQFPEKTISNINIQKIKNIHTNLLNVDLDKFKYLNKAIQDFDNLEFLPYYSAMPFKTMAIFSILESLLTHDSDTSIRSQFKNKIMLLNNRFDEPLPFDKYFENGKEETILTKLYDYRSDIAHGDFSDFEKELKILKNHSSIYDFIYLLLRKILIQAIKEPQLINDLKKV